MIRLIHLRRFGKLLLLGVIAFGLVSACGVLSSNSTDQKQTATANCRMIEHDAGQTQICGQPQRIAVLGPHMLDILLSLDMQPAGYAEFSATNLGEPIEEIPVLGDRVTNQPINLGLRNTPSLEAILQLKPDLIIGEVFHGRQFYSQFTQIAPTLLYNGSNQEDWQQGLRGVAKALQREEKAEQVIADYRQKLAETRELLAPIVAAYPKLLLAIAARLPAVFSVNDPSSFTGGIFADLGFDVLVPAVEKPRESWLSVELLPQLDADIVIAIISDYLREDAMDYLQHLWQQNSITQEMAATQAGRVYFVDGYLWISNIRGPIAANMILDQARQLLLPLQESQ